LFIDPRNGYGCGRKGALPGAVIVCGKTEFNWQKSRAVSRPNFVPRILSYGWLRKSSSALCWSKNTQTERD